MFPPHKLFFSNLFVSFVYFLAKYQIPFSFRHCKNASCKKQCEIYSFQMLLCSTVPTFYHFYFHHSLTYLTVFAVHVPRCISISVQYTESNVNQSLILCMCSHTLPGANSDYVSDSKHHKLPLSSTAHNFCPHLRTRNYIILRDHKDKRQFLGISYLSSVGRHGAGHNSLQVTAETDSFHRDDGLLSQYCSRVERS